MRTSKLVLICSLIMLTCTTAIPVVAAEDSSQSFEIVEASKSVVMAENQRGSNMVCIAVPDGLVFVDAGLSTEQAARFRAMMEQRFAKKATMLLLTHGHLDHFLGMAAFKDVEIVAAEVGRSLFEDQLALNLTGEKTVAAYSAIYPTYAEDVVTAEPFLPTKWFKDELVIGAGEDRLIFTNTGGHSPDSSSVYFPREKVVVAGDLLQTERRPYFGDPGNDFNAWIVALKGWYELKAKTFCPGHGPKVGRRYLPKVWEYFEDLQQTMAELKAEGVSPQQAVFHPDLPEGYWPVGQPTPKWWKWAILKVYQESGP